MIRILFIMLLIINVSYAGSERYFIKFGSFKNLKGLERSVNKMPKYLRSHVSIIRTKGWYVPFAYYRKSKRGLSSKLRVYKRYFPDAYVAHGHKMFRNKIIYKFGKRKHRVLGRKFSTKKVKYIRKNRTVKSKHVALQNMGSLANREVSVKELEYTQIDRETKPIDVTPQDIEYTQKNITVNHIPVTLQDVDISGNDNTLNIPQQNYSSQNIPSILEALPTLSSMASTVKIEQKNYNYFTKQMLSGNHYYMTYKDPNGRKNLLIKVSFRADSVSYQPVLGDMQMTQANYVVENNRLYMYAEEFSANGAYSTLDKHRNGYFLVSSWMGGKKLNTLRYYYKLNDAKVYLGVDVSSGLSEVLQEGNFDEFFLDEDEY